MHTLDLTISDISKIEGKASCSIKVREGKVKEVKFSIAEYRRFYTQALRGKDILALPQLSCRICGTCSNAHLLCAIKAAEDALGIVPSEQTILLRKLLNFALIIRDHALHLYVFVLPDLFGKDSILDFDENNKKEHKYLDDTFSVKKAGNNLGKIVGGRSVHAPFVTIAGFTKLFKEEDLKKCTTELESIRKPVLDLIELLATQDNELVVENLNFASIVDEEYSFLDGEFLKSEESCGEIQKYGDYLQKRIIKHSQAPGYLIEGKITMFGALARLNLVKDKIHPRTKKDTEKYLSLFPSKNIFFNNLAQAIEILHAVDSSIAIIKKIKIIEEKPVLPLRKESKGIGLIEAPRGILYYNLEIDSQGKIKDVQIVVPTSVNQVAIEESIIEYLNKNIENLKDKESVEHEVERLVRAFDPCMSCASHFLKFRWHKE